jgi:uncharacterized tellurite resistance protein B-like protein
MHRGGFRAKVPADHEPGENAMRDAIRSLFQRTTPNPTPRAVGRAGDPLRIAAAALLLEVAHADEEFTAIERDHIEEALGRHFDLEDNEIATLLELAEIARREATDLHQFTAVINERYDEGQRLLLAEILWRVVLADGELSRHESYLMRKLANLLDLRPGFLAEARKRAGGVEEPGA